MSLLDVAPGLAAYLLVVAGLLGLVMGSFLNCWAWRMTHGESVLRGRSHCDSCGHVLGAADLVPVASWLASRGRCRYCGAPISARCPATELICCALFVSLMARYGLALGGGSALELAELLCLGCALFLASLTDIDEMIIPNGCVLFALAVRVVYLVLVAAGVDGGSAGAAVVASGFWARLASLALPYALSAVGVGVALVVLALIMDRVLGRESLGGGDVKLLALVAFYVGWQQCLLVLLVACVLGIIVGLAQMRRAGTEAAKAGGADGAVASAGEDPRVFPWGPSIAIAAWFVLLFGDQIIAWYLSLFL